MFQTLSAQDYAQLRGRILNPAGQNISFASILLFNSSDSTMVKTGFSNEQGKFALAPLKAGQYFLKVQFAGLRTYAQKDLTISAGETLDLGSIQMENLEANLDEVQIVAQKPLVEVRPDKTIFNVAGNAIAVGESAFELLRKAPGVMIDNSDNVLLMGKSGVRIYIDGKPSPLSIGDLAAMLKGMQSEQIEAIEIISNPSAKYDAEGNAGIINILLKKDKSLGTNVSASLGYGIGRFAKYNGSLNMNSRNKKANFFGNYSGNTGNTFSFTDFVRTQSDLVLSQRSDRLNESTNHNFKLGVDIFLNDKQTLGIMANGFFGETDGRSESFTPIMQASTGNALSDLVAFNEFDTDNQNLNFNINYELRPQKGSKLNIDADYGRYKLRSNSFQPNYFLNPVEGDTISSTIFAIQAPTNIDIYTLKADYEKDWLKGKLSAGAKFALIHTDNDFGYYDVVGGEEQLNTDRSNRFNYRENINAAYISYQKQIQKWNLSLGLRAEQTLTKGELISTQNTGLDTVDRKYINLFPTAGATYSINRQNSMGFTYSRRIDRPRYQDLNPFVSQLDQLSFQQGNPFLRPQYTHSFQVSHTYKYRYTTSISYSLTNDYFTQLTDTFSRDASFIRQENLAKRKVLSANISAPISLTKWWSTYTNMNVSRMQNEGDFNLPGETGKGIDITRTTFSLFQQHTFTINQWLSWELSGFYNSPTIWGANYLTREFWSVNTGAQIRFLQNKANLKLSVTDIFYSMQWQGIQEFGALVYDASGGWESRQFKINFTYSFGNDKVKASRKRKTGLQDEASRVN